MDRLWQPERQLVHGYLCVEESDEVHVAAWTREITDFATTSGYRLGSLFIDRVAPTGSFARSGFIELLATLRRPESYAVVVPSIVHFSNDSFIQQVLIQMIRLTDSQLLVSTVINGNSSKIAPSTELGTES